MEEELKHFQIPAVLKAEQTYLSSFLSSLRGYHLLLLGAHRKLGELPSHCLHAFGLSPSPAVENTFAWIQSHYGMLPLRDNSIDAAIVPYLLEYCENPYELLKELYRSLMGEGKLFLLGFERLHPWCWFNAPRYKNIFSSLQIKKLLIESDFSIEKIKHFHYGALYFIVAQKHITLLTPMPLRPRWEIPLFDKTWAKSAARKERLSD